SVIFTLCSFFLLLRRPTSSTLFPYTTLFRSVGTMAIFAEPGSTWALYLLAGRAEFASESGLGQMQAGDTALLPGGEARRRYLLDGAGEALLIRLAPRDQ